LKELTSKRDEAVQVGDLDQFKELDVEVNITKNRVAEAEHEIKKEESFEEQKEIPEEAKAFYDKNKSWFNADTSENKKMMEDALIFDELIGIKVSKGLINVTPAEACQLVENHIKKLYPERFESDAKSDPIAVSKSSEGATTTSKEKLKLSAHQENVYQAYKKVDPTFTRDEYIKQLDLLGEISR
jgi:hypothetical protein